MKSVLEYHTIWRRNYRMTSPANLFIIHSFNTSSKIYLIKKCVFQFWRTPFFAQILYLWTSYSCTIFKSYGPLCKFCPPAISHACNLNEAFLVPNIRALPFPVVFHSYLFSEAHNCLTRTCVTLDKSRLCHLRILENIKTMACINLRLIFVNWTERK